MTTIKINEKATLHFGDCIAKMKEMADCSVDSIVTDPPYELGFMGKSWDASGIANNPDMWREALRVLKPGGHLLAFSGSRTYHRMTCAIEDAGFEVRDQIMWIYGSGFPKSHNLKDDWKGWGTALKPAHEPICVARKPLIGTVAANVLAHGTGAINVDWCRVSSESGRWPANLIHDGSEEVLAGFPTTTSGNLSPHHKTGTNAGINVKKAPVEYTKSWGGDTGSAARFFYCAKASKVDRDQGLEGFEVKRTGGMQATADGSMLTGSGNERTTTRANTHPTVKPTDLMRYLCRLVTQPNGVILDPFMGSGSTGKAAVLEGFNFIGIDMTEEYISIAKARIQSALHNINNEVQNNNNQLDLI